ncbi:Ammonia channel [Pontiella sulfatireligans]|uniref:Ammonia channel n=1 Tax=Pontiella sulfatireligans TaxID=2750658 RepID=A0A6C2UQ38_9BACT|nr:hypothetical protein [Pontiella sulfatireligans]VGO21427.1 Ammonia channel [Pontiella sulfatireligans]
MLKGIDESIMDAGIPEYVFAMFQGKFAIITPALIAGAFAERIKFRGYCIFIALWSLIIYNPLCHWVWAEDDFLFQKGAIDFAGGTVIHISAGAAALVAAFHLGPRRGYPKTAMHPNNLVMTLMGAGLLWVGWFGYDDTLDVFGIHGVAALWGAIGLTFVLRPGTIDVSVMHQLWVQTEGCLVSLTYSGVMTFILIVIVDKLFGFRMSEDEEKAGIDHSLHSERGYGMVNLNS